VTRAHAIGRPVSRLRRIGAMTEVDIQVWLWHATHFFVDGNPADAVRSASAWQ